MTSREPLHWNESSDHLVLHNLQCYPEDEARILLEETIKNRPDLVDQIIESTQCVPIYIDLALNVYESQEKLIIRLNSYLHVIMFILFLGYN